MYENIELILILLLIALALWRPLRALRRPPKPKAGWGDLRVYADQLGLSYMPKGKAQSLQGRLRGVAMSLEVTARDKAIFQARHPQPVTAMRIFSEDVTAAFGKPMGLTQDIEIGDPEFDHRMVLQAEDPEVLAAILTPEIRKRLLHFSVIYPGFVLDTRGVEWRSPTPGHTLAEVEAVFQNFADLILLIQRTLHRDEERLWDAHTTHEAQQEHFALAHGEAEAKVRS